MIGWPIRPLGWLPDLLTQTARAQKAPPPECSRLAAQATIRVTPACGVQLTDVKWPLHRSWVALAAAHIWLVSKLRGADLMANAKRTSSACIAICSAWTREGFMSINQSINQSIDSSYLHARSVLLGGGDSAVQRDPHNSIARHRTPSPRQHRWVHPTDSTAGSPLPNQPHQAQLNRHKLWCSTTTN